MQEREKNRAAMKSLVRCTHFLTRHHIALTYFSQLVDLVVSWGARELQVFVENASRNAVYTSRGAVVDFIEALGTREHGNTGTWEHGNMGTREHGNMGTREHGNMGTRVEEPILKRLQKAAVFSVMADECTDITAVGKLSVFCRWVEDGTLAGYSWTLWL